MSRFGRRPEDFFREVYDQTPPWDIGAAQPALLPATCACIERMA